MYTRDYDTTDPLSCMADWKYTATAVAAEQAAFNVFHHITTDHGDDDRAQLLADSLTAWSENSPAWINHVSASHKRIPNVTDFACWVHADVTHHAVNDVLESLTKPEDDETPAAPPTDSGLMFIDGYPPVDVPIPGAAGHTVRLRSAFWRTVTKKHPTEPISFEAVSCGLDSSNRKCEAPQTVDDFVAWATEMNATTHLQQRVVQRLWHHMEMNARTETKLAQGIPVVCFYLDGLEPLATPPTL